MRRLLSLLICVFVLAPASVSAASDPLRPYQYGLDKINAPEAWTVTRGSGALIAVIDTGVNGQHVDLAGRLVPGHDFVDDDADPRDESGPGTAVAGVAAANADNGIGIAGIAPQASILPVRVLDAGGNGSQARIVEGIDYAVNRAKELRRPLVVNISIPDPLRLVARAYGQVEASARAASDAGAVVVFAASAQLSGRTRDWALVTGPSSADDSPSWYAAGTPNIVAPGDGILTTRFDPNRPSVHDLYTCGEPCTQGDENGSGYAAASVSGVAALLLSRGLAATDVRTRILDSADKPPDQQGCTSNYGCGRVNAARAVAGSKAAAATAVPAASPAPRFAPPVAAPGTGRTTKFAPAAPVQAPGAPELGPPAGVGAVTEAAPTNPPAPFSNSTFSAPEERRPVRPLLPILIWIAVAAGAIALSRLVQTYNLGKDARPAAAAGGMFPVLDGVRGLAVLSVVIVHFLYFVALPYGWVGRRHANPLLWPFAAGDLGVDLFFVLSGFLLVRSWNSVRRKREGPTAYAEYARRRAIRLLPAFWLSLAVLIPLRAPEWFTSAEGWRNIFLFFSVQQTLSPNLPEKLNVTSWSLTTEVHFYLLLPLVAVAFARFGRRKLIGAALAISVLWRLGTWKYGWPIEWLPSRIDQFVIGMAASALVDAGRSHPVVALLRRRGVGIALGIITVAIVCYHGAWFALKRPVWQQVLTHPIMGLLIGALLVRLLTSDRRSILENRTLRFFGVISYSLYLWHWAFMTQAQRWGWLTPDAAGVAHVLLLIALAILASLATYVFIEQPAMRFKRGREPVAPNPATAQSASSQAV